MPSSYASRCGKTNRIIYWREFSRSPLEVASNLLDQRGDGVFLRTHHHVESASARRVRGDRADRRRLEAVDAADQIAEIGGGAGTGEGDHVYLPRRDHRA